MRREGAGRAVAAGGDHLELARVLRAVREVANVGLGEILVEDVGAAAVEVELPREDDLLQPAHLVRAEGHGPLRAIFTPVQPLSLWDAVNHRHGRHVEVELGEIAIGDMAMPMSCTLQPEASRPATSAYLIAAE